MYNDKTYIQEIEPFHPDICGTEPTILDQCLGGTEMAFSLKIKALIVLTNGSRQF